MSFRDDHDAALARADALEAEVLALGRQRDRLQAELEAMRDERVPAHTQPMGPHDSERVILRLSALMTILFVLVAIGANAC